MKKSYLYTNLYKIVQAIEIMPGNTIENPRVGGSFPPLGTI
jgi:hypothetical protein